MVEAAGATAANYPSICERLGEAKDLLTHVRDVGLISNEIEPSLLESPARPDLVIADASAFWARRVAHVWGAPLAGSVTTFVFTRSMLQLIARPAWMTDADIEVLATTGALKVVYTSAMFQPAGQFLDDSHVFVGPLMDHRTVRDGVRVEPEGARPLAYVSLGTIYGGDVALLKRVSSYLSAAGWQVVVSLGTAGAGETGEWPPYVRAYAFVDQLALLANARLVVTHGGLHTVTEALAYGVPLVVMPQDVDQHVVGRRAASLGAAITVDATTMSRDDFSAALARIDAERPQFEQAAATVGRSFAGATPLATAVQRLLGLAAGGARGDR